MPEHLRALVVILFLATAVFAVAKAPACALASTSGDFERRRNLWFGIVLAAFLAQDFWIYIILASALLLSALPREPNKLAMFYFLLFAVPALPGEVTGLGLINYFFVIDYVRLLTLAVLLPAFLYLRRQPDTERFGHFLADKLVAGYIILQFVLMLPATTFTNALRFGAFYGFIDIFLPYYVASRAVRDLQGFRDALMAFVVAALVLSAISAFEFGKHWLLFKSLEDVLGALQWGYGNYLRREGSLRAVATSGQPIVLGCIITVATGFYLYLRKLVPSPRPWALGLVLLMAGLIASVSRGPWVGAAAMLVIFVALGPSPVRGLKRLALLGALVLAVLLMSPAGQGIIDLMPFVGEVEAENVKYREDFTKASIQTIIENPFFGSSEFATARALQELTGPATGYTYLDLLNAFLTVAMGSGLIGLALFAGLFITVGAGIFKRMRRLADKNDEVHLLGRALLAAMLGIVVIMNTVSFILLISTLYWSLAGLGVAYVRMLATVRAPSKAPERAGRTRFPSASLRNR
jgi:O-antigen ligase